MSALAPQAKYPSAKFPSLGTEYEGEIVEPPVSRQAKKFNSSELDYWPSGDPVMTTKIVLKLDSDDSTVAVYAQKELAKAVTKALVEAEAADVEMGGRLKVKYSANDPESKNPAQPRKLYEAKYTPPEGGDWNPGDLD